MSLYLSSKLDFRWGHSEELLRLFQLKKIPSYYLPVGSMDPIQISLVKKQTAGRTGVKYYREAKYNPTIINITPVTLPGVRGSLNSR